MLGEGETVGPYELVRKLGGGTFGEVWLARHTDLDVERAVKVPTDPDYVRQLRREGKIQFGLRHPNIVQTLELFTRHDPPYFVMEYVEGQDLRGRLNADAPLPVDEVLGILRQVLAALGAAHEQGVVHRDLKPENILLTPDGAVKVADFGLGAAQATVARTLLLSGSLVTSAGRSVSGTFAYMSPEQQAGEEPTPAADLYALGVIACEMLAGRRPSAAGVATTLARAQAPRHIAEVVQTACDDLEYRYATAHDMLAALDQALGEAPEHAAEAPETAVEAPETDCPLCGAACTLDEHRAAECPVCGLDFRLGEDGEPTGCVTDCPHCNAELYVEGTGTTQCTECGEEFVLHEDAEEADEEEEEEGEGEAEDAEAIAAGCPYCGEEFDVDGAGEVACSGCGEAFQVGEDGHAVGTFVVCPHCAKTLYTEATETVQCLECGRDFEMAESHMLQTQVQASVDDIVAPLVRSYQSHWRRVFAGFVVALLVFWRGFGWSFWISGVLAFIVGTVLNGLLEPKLKRRVRESAEALNDHFPAPGARRDAALAALEAKTQQDNPDAAKALLEAVAPTQAG